MTAYPNLAVVARRIEPADSLDFFPTPPWATRALVAWLEREMGIFSDELSVLDPCCGEGHMAAVLGRYAGRVVALDVHDYGYGGLRDFLDTSDPAGEISGIDWTIMNPPFGHLSAFLERAQAVSRAGVAMLCRMSVLEGVRRYHSLWQGNPPNFVLPFAERVPMHRGRWVVNGKTATSYMWLIWRHSLNLPLMQLRHLPPGMRKTYSRINDPVRFAGVYQLRTLISKPKAKKKEWKTTFHSPAEWAAMGRVA